MNVMVIPQFLGRCATNSTSNYCSGLHTYCQKQHAYCLKLREFYINFHYNDRDIIFVPNVSKVHLGCLCFYVKQYFSKTTRLINFSNLYKVQCHIPVPDSMDNTLLTT